MKLWARSRLATVLAGIALAGLAATWAVDEVPDGNQIARQGRHEVARMTQKMKTVCVGRFLIDMPEEAQIALHGARLDGFNISAFTETNEGFQERLLQREAQLRSKPDRLGGNRNLEIEKKVGSESGIVGKMFVHSRTVTEGTATNGLDLERYRYEGVAVEALVHANGISVDLAADDYYPDRVANLPRLIEKLAPVAEGELPAESGFCIGRANFKDPLTADQGEEIVMVARLPSHPDIEFLLVLAAGINPAEQGLLERNSDSKSRMPFSMRWRFTELRAGERDVNGLLGEELVTCVVEENDANVYGFWWEVNGTRDNVLIPHLMFRMDTGRSNDGPVPSSISEDAALGLWDKIVSSIRVRSVAPSNRPVVNEAAVPIGTQALAGGQCPQSGWWLCSDGGNGVGVLGGQRQYIQKGERMPQALLLLPQTLWDKVRGLQPSVESKHPTSWKLVDQRARKRTSSELPLATAAMPAGATFSAAGSDSSQETRLSVGSYSSTGMPCPASGWWRCEESHALDGTRWFAQGSLLPPATFAVAPGVFGRSTKGPKVIQRRSAWRLMRVADMPQAVGENGSSNPGGLQLIPPSAHRS